MIIHKIRKTFDPYSRFFKLPTNIAEDVIYMIEGDIIRHKTEEYQPVT